MAKFVLLLLSAFSGLLLQGTAASQTIDLSDASGLEFLRTSRPQHYDLLQQIVRGLAEQPSRVEGNWLALNFGASDVQRGPLLTNYGIDSPKQAVRFRLGDSPYQLSVLRTDIVVEVLPQRQTLLP